MNTLTALPPKYLTAIGPLAKQAIRFGITDKGLSLGFASEVSEPLLARYLKVEDFRVSRDGIEDGVHTYFIRDEQRP